MPGHTTLLSLGAGFAVWSAGFALVYAVLSVGCAWGWDAIDLGPVSTLRAVVAGLAVLTLAGSLLTAAFLRERSPPAHRSGQSDPSGFVATIAFRAGLAALAATLFTFSGIAALSMCS